tara:strand:- start:5909 stop:6373 length:465 start_codon:yes stop_codon:yes gene_type:complete
MNGEEKLNEFLQRVDEWLSLQNLPAINVNPNIEQTLNLSQVELQSLSAEDCLAMGYELYAYSEFLQHCLSKEKIILDWADNSIWYIVSDKLNQYGDKFTKWQEKYYAAIKENPLASQILKIKNNATSRVTLLDGKSDKIIKMANTLETLSKRRR